MGINYFLGNKDLAIAALNLLDGVQDQIQWELKVNLKNLEKKNIQQNDLEEEPPSHQFAFKTAIIMLGKTTRNSYTRLCEQIAHNFNCEPSVIPSFHQMTKNRPKILPITFGCLKNDNDGDNNGNDSNHGKCNNTQFTNSNINININRNSCNLNTLSLAKPTIVTKKKKHTQ